MMKRGSLPEEQWYRLTVEETLRRLRVDPREGLSLGEAEERLRRVGHNDIGEERPIRPLALLLRQLNSFLVYVLLVAALMSGLLLRETVDMVVILAIVAANAALGFFQEYRAEKALRALKRLSSPRARVRREGEIATVDAATLVPGDVILVEEGDLVAADARIINAASLRVNESALTGEVEATAKTAAAREEEGLGPGDQTDMLFLGTYVEAGRGEAVVVETGRRTVMGGIAVLMEEAEETETPLQRELKLAGKRIALLCLATCILIFIEGILSGQEWRDLFMFSVSLAVAAIPEGMPAVVTVALSLGLRRLAASRAIVRRLAAVETLGSTGVICTDKTGTITRGEMAVRRLWAPDCFDLELDDRRGEKEEAPGSIGGAVAVAILCNNASPKSGGYQGEGTEVALMKMADALGYERETLEKAFPRVGEVPFESERRMMSTFHRVDQPSASQKLFLGPNTPHLLLAKGAPEEVVHKCDRILLPGGIAPLKEAMVRLIMDEVEGMAARGLRTLAFAFRPLLDAPGDFSVISLEKEMVFAGLAGMIDPPRPEVLRALEECRNAHIRVVMITGDHASTARSIASELGILRPGDEILLGSELARMDQRELEGRVERVSIYARVSPADKVKIVRAWKSRGAVVAMTGDGVNDAPALKNADIGVAMGVTGTDVSKEAADMVLADDNFATIVEAVREGRAIYDNLKKFVNFLLSCNLSEVVTMFVGMLVVGHAPLQAVQVLWMNLATDGFPAMALGVDTPLPNIMRRPPRDPSERMLSWQRIRRMTGEGIALSIGALSAFFLGWYWLYPGKEGINASRTMVFAVLVLAQLLHSLNCRSEESSFFRLKPIVPAAMMLAMLGSLLMLTLVLWVPPLMKAFGTERLSAGAWLVVLACAALPPLAIDRAKALRSAWRR